jgi:hypothetical protein
MFLKALLLADDIRFEVGGTMTLVGIYGERVLVPPDAPLDFTRLVFVTVVGGLSGVERLGYRHTLRAVDAPGQPKQTPLRQEAHDPAVDEHTFVFGEAPLSFPGEGAYEITTEIEAGSTRGKYSYRFRVERIQPG